VSVLDSTSERVLRTVVVGHYPALVAVDVAGGRVLVVHGWSGTGDAQAGGQGIGGAGATDVLDARTGQLLATLPAGAVAPEAVAPGTQASLVAVDERRGHVFVLEQSTGDTAAGRVRALDDRMPRVLRSVAVAPFPAPWPWTRQRTASSCCMPTPTAAPRPAPGRSCPPRSGGG
jgi:DNA-binding beta-propeller fold protein YncE